ncbi:MAG: STT3 domain-containing protein [Candidatus Helarchaeota archaeon]
MPSFKDKLVWNLKKIFHRPTVQIGKANIILYTTIILIFIIALILRLFPALRYAAELRALDPYCQFKATRYIIEHGLPAYFSWHETMSWAPNGVDMGPYLYLGTPFAGAFFYYFFQFLGLNLTIYDTCVVTPAIMGALSCIVMYFLGKELAGNKKTGLLAAFFLAICVGFQTRTITGFYDNEAVGLFGMILFFFFFIKSLKTGSIPYAVLAGMSLSVLSLSWGAYTYIWDLLPLTVLFLIILKKYSSRLLLAYGVSWSISLLSVVLLPRTGWDVIESGEAVINFGILGLCLLIEFYRQFKETALYDYIKEHWKILLRISLFGLLILLIATSITGALQSFIVDFIGGDIIAIRGGRYLVAIFPWMSSLTISSVAEHMPSAWGLFYYNYEFLLFLFPLGLYFLFKRLYEEDLFIIVFGLTTVYFASSMSRVQMVFAPAICLIGAFGVASLIKPFSLVLRKKFVTVRRRKRTATIVTREVSVAIFSLMFFILLFTSIHGTYNAAYQLAQPGMGNDWRETFAWMRANLDSDDVVVSWWDYGYQMTTVGEVTTVIDNGTWNNTAMGMVGRMFMAIDEAEALEILKSQWDADYVLVSWSYFYPNGGGDEGKWQWMIRIAYEQLRGTKWAIDIGERWNETSYKPTCEFFDTTLWKMLTYYEPFIDYDADEGNAGVIDYLIQHGYPLGYFLARLNWADPWKPGSKTEQGQWLDDSGHLWKYHNPPLGDGMIDDGMVNYDNDPEDDTVGQFANLKYFTPVFMSTGHLVKVFKIDYDKAKLRAQITDDSQLFNNSVAKLTINNNGQINMDIQSIKINEKSVNFVPISGTTTGIEPGAECQIKAYGPDLAISDIKNGTTYTVEVTVRSGAYTYTTTKAIIAEPAPYINMSIEEFQIRVLSNETIFVPITNTGNDLLEIASVQVNNQSISNFGTHYSSIGETQIDVNCNYTEFGFSPTNITATQGDLINFHITNAKPGSTIKFEIPEFNKEILVSYGQTEILPVEAVRNGTFPIYCYDILWPPDEYKVGNLTISEGTIEENWNYKFIGINQTKLLKIQSSQDLKPNQFINLTISTNTNEGVSRSFYHLQVFSGTSCLTVLNATAFANETVFLTIKNTGAYNETIDHIWLNGEIFDIYSTPNPNGYTLLQNETADFLLTFSPSILNLNITSPYDPKPLQVNISLMLDSRTMDPESQHEQLLEVLNNYDMYNISITDEIYSNETIFLKITNVGSRSVEISDIWINNISTTTFSTNDSSIIDPASTTTFNITSQLNLDYLDNAQILVRTYEGPYALINRTVEASGKINISWSEAYQNNQTIFLNVTNLRGTPITVQSILINSLEAFDFTPIDDTFQVLPNSFKTIPGYGHQLFNVTMTYSQFLSLDLTVPLSINVTTFEGVFIVHNATWAYAIRVNKVFAFTNNTVFVYIKNTGRYPVTINDIYLNSSSTEFTLLSGSYTPSPGTVSLFKLISSTPLLFGNTLEIEATANYTLTLENISDTYHMPFVIYNGPNITIIEGWPNTVAFDNSTTSNNDTVYVTIMNTGNTTFSITNFYLNNTVHLFNRIDNQSILIFEPYQSATFANWSIIFDISAESGQFLEVNVTTDIVVDTLHNLSAFVSLRILHNQPNITIMENNATIAYRYTTPIYMTVTVNLTNFGDRELFINFQNDLRLNDTANYFTGTIILKPGESVVKYAILDENDPLISSNFLKISIIISLITDELIVEVYSGN